MILGLELGLVKFKYFNSVFYNQTNTGHHSERDYQNIFAMNPITSANGHFFFKRVCLNIIGMRIFHSLFTQVGLNIL